MKKPVIWIIGYLAITIAALAFIGAWVVKVDPFFHYHKPDTESYYYTLDNERSMNNGITRHFDYQGIITGTSMTQNFKTTQAEELFQIPFIKVPYSGSSYREINDNLKVALACHPDVKMIIRGLDLYMFFYDKDYIRNDLGKYPMYLYDDNLFNDVEYVFNRDVVFKRVYPMEKAGREPGFTGGITSFDDYSNWMADGPVFGFDAVFPEGLPELEQREISDLTPDLKETVLGNIRQNITELAGEYPDVTFYYFLTPYSAAWWREQLFNGTLARQVEVERLAIEEMLACGNIRLFSFNCMTDITANMDNYKDECHYGEWVNSQILQYMKEGTGLITRDNYEAYLQQLYDLYLQFDYSTLGETTPEA